MVEREEMENQKHIDANRGCQVLSKPQQEGGFQCICIQNGIILD